MKLFRKSKEDDNATKKCGDCLAEIPAKAKKCEHCGAKQKFQFNWKHGVLMFLAVSVVLGAFDSSRNPRTPTQEKVEVTVPSEPEKEEVTKRESYIISQHYVKMALISPSTADFPFSDFTAIKGGNRWRVTSYVDSQNEYGAMIRTQYSIVLKYTGEDWAEIINWELKELEFDGLIIYPL